MDNYKNQDVKKMLYKLRGRAIARFLDHLKDTGQYTERIADDYKRQIYFTFNDIFSILDGGEK